MKKIILVICIGLLISAGVVFAYTGGSLRVWNDVKNTDWFYDAAIFAVNHGFMTGPGGKFMPGKSMTRGQASVMLQKFAYNVHFEQTPRVFIDPWYGFKLTFPDSWRTSLYESSSAPAVEEYDVPMPVGTRVFGATNFNGKFESLFTLEIWRKHDWETPVGLGDVGTFAPKDNEVAAGNVVGQNNSYVVVLTPSEGMVSGELSQTQADIPTIRQSFMWVVGQ